METNLLDQLEEKIAHLKGKMEGLKIQLKRSNSENETLRLETENLKRERDELISNYERVKGFEPKYNEIKRKEEAIYERLEKIVTTIETNDELNL